MMNVVGIVTVGDQYQNLIGEAANSLILNQNVPQIHAGRHGINLFPYCSKFGNCFRTIRECDGVIRVEPCIPDLPGLHRHTRG